MDKSPKDQYVTHEEFDGAMTAIKQEFNMVHDKFREVDERFDKVDQLISWIFVY